MKVTRLQTLDPPELLRVEIELTPQEAQDIRLELGVLDVVIAEGSALGKLRTAMRESQSARMNEKRKTQT